MTSRFERAFLTCALLLTIVLLWAGVAPSASKLEPSRLHHLAHFVSFAVLAIAWSFALPRVPAVLIALSVVGFGLAQEVIEIFGHSHGLELRDVIVDAAGALAGVVFARVYLTWFRPP